MKRKQEQNALFKTIRLLAISLILVGNSHHLSAQEGSKQVAIGKTIGLDSDILDEKRNIYVYCPPDYDKENKTYPTLYLLDAEYQFHYVTGVIAFLSEINHIPEMIVIGITNTDRNRDLTPEPGEAQKRRFPTAGGAERFLDFLQNELVPYIESRYRVEPYRVLAGWSLGGLLSIHAMLSRPAVFNAYLATSPSLYWNDQIEIDRAKEVLGQMTSFNRSLFMTIGNERDEMVNSSRRFAEVLERYAPSDFSWKFEPMPEETHSSIKLKSIYGGLEFIFSDLRLVENLGDASFGNYQKKLQRKYGAHRVLSQDFLQRAYDYYWQNKKFGDAVDVIAYFAGAHSEAFSNLSPRFVQPGKVLIDNELYEYAIRLLELVTAVNDKIFDARKGLGDAYSALGKEGEALENYERASTLRPGDPYIQERINKLAKKNPGNAPRPA